jgi:RNA polymerase sigma factor (sigma-70 family)
MGIRQARVMRDLHHLFRLGAIGGASDAQLVAQFLASEDIGADAAFEVLVQRHGPMVMRVCRGVLRDEHDAEDAFQTTFIVLARKARSLWVKDSLASWLHGVAYRVASRAKSDAMRRRRHERRAATEAAGRGNPSVFRPDDEAIISEEIARLPEKYREPTVLCYLEAMSYQAAANRLGLTEDAVRGRLARARERLRSRLACRGVEPSAILGAARPAIAATRLVRPGLLQATVQAALSVSVERVVDRFLIEQTAVSLSERIGSLMTRTKLATGVLTLSLGVIAAGAVVLAQPTSGPQAERARPVSTPKSAEASTGSTGHLIVDWVPSGKNAEKTDITVDAARHCVHLAPFHVKKESRPNDGAVRLDLERGKTYTVAAAGEAFMSASTGREADPFPGVVLVYGTDEEDGYAIRQTVLAAGKSITFKTPWAIKPEDEVFLMAFFLDIWPDTKKRGSYALTVTDVKQCPVRFLKDGVDLDGDGAHLDGFGASAARDTPRPTVVARDASCLKCHASTAVHRELSRPVGLSR